MIRKRRDTTPPDPPPGTWRTLRAGEVHEEVNPGPPAAAPAPAPTPRPAFVVHPDALHPGIDPAPEPAHRFERAGG